MHIDQEPISIGERRELFIDNYLIDSMDRVELLMHEPERKNVAITCDRPWEGTRVGYVGVIKDDNIFRMYYTAGSYDMRPPLFISYAEGEDGVTFIRPNLGLFEVEATRENNVVLTEILGRPGPTTCRRFWIRIQMPLLMQNTKRSVRGITARCAPSNRPTASTGR